MYNVTILIDPINPFSNFLKRQSSLKMLILDNCSIFQQDFTCLIDSLKLNRTLEEVEVKGNAFYICGGGKFFEMVKINKKLKKFDFDKEETERKQVEEILKTRNNN